VKFQDLTPTFANQWPFLLRRCLTQCAGIAVKCIAEGPSCKNRADRTAATGTT